MMVFRTASHLLVAMLLIGAADAHAGFEMKGSALTLVAPIEQMPLQPGGTSIRTAPQTGLSVSQERYIPPRLRLKYGMDGAQQSLTVMPQPSSDPMMMGPLTPEPMPQPMMDNAPMPIVQPAPEQIPHPMDPMASIAPPAANPAYTTLGPAVEPMVPPAAVLDPAAAEPPRVSPPPKSPVDTWRARKGEDVRDILKRWTARANTQFVWAAADSAKLEKDYSYVGTLSDAVGGLMKTAGVTNLSSQYRPQGMNPVMDSPAASEQILTSSSAAAPSVPFSRGVEPSTAGHSRWFALTGASLRDVLKVWADDANAVLLWQSDRTFAVKETISAEGTFEDAVTAALGQYQNDPLRPLGEIYTMPDTAQKVLVVKTGAPGV